MLQGRCGAAPCPSSCRLASFPHLPHLAPLNMCACMHTALARAACLVPYVPWFSSWLQPSGSGTHISRLSVLDAQRCTRSARQLAQTAPGVRQTVIKQPPNSHQTAIKQQRNTTLSDPRYRNHPHHHLEAAHCLPHACAHARVVTLAHTHARTHARTYASQPTTHTRSRQHRRTRTFLAVVCSSALSVLPERISKRKPS